MKSKIIASSAAGLALLGGTVAYAVSGGTANAATTPSTTQTTTQSAKGWLGHHRRELRRDGAKAVAKDLGISVQQLRTDLKSGQTIAQVANAKGVSTSTIESELTKQVDARIQQAVTKGRLTQARATKIEAKVPTFVDKAINHQFGQHK
jgi:hypothetical protein